MSSSALSPFLPRAGTDAVKGMNISFLWDVQKRPSSAAGQSCLLTRLLKGILRRYIGKMSLVAEDCPKSSLMMWKVPKNHTQKLLFFWRSILMSGSARSFFLPKRRTCNLAGPFGVSTPGFIMLIYLLPKWRILHLYISTHAFLYVRMISSCGGGPSRETCCCSIMAQEGIKNRSYFLATPWADAARCVMYGKKFHSCTLGPFWKVACYTLDPKKHGESLAALI